MKYLIIGGSGFIGQAITKRLLDSGSNEVTIIDKHVPRACSDFILKDISKDECRSVPNNFEVIINCASILGISRVEEAPFETLINNFWCAKFGLDIAKQQKELFKYVYFSTSEVYGKLAENKSEDSSLVVESSTQSRWSYATSKIFGEQLTCSFCKDIHVPFIIIRPFNVYGVGRKKEGAINSLINQAICKQKVEITGTGMQMRAWCYISDFVDGLLLCIEKGSNNSIYNIGNPKELYSIKDLVTIVSSIIEKNVDITYKEKRVDIINRSPNISRMKELGFSPKITVYEGMREIIRKGYKNEIKS